ncbi:MAG: prepilin-type N-terminal cleavage/methylation domain-containing protein [Kiritimatiellae bacterium]|nr:prepilin-type N-terminal cleavage/methylation domain-containing protein [Kiritimatiellia bacterium]
MHRRNEGYSLVEVTLAILVIGLGMVAVYSLFPAGLSMNKRAEDETRAAIFAQEVLDGYHALVDHDPVAWERLGPPYSDDPTLEAVAFGMWENADTIEIEPNTATQTVSYVNYNGGVENSFRYVLVFWEPVDNKVKAGHIRVWNGAFGPSAPKDAVDFYTEFYNYRRTP